MARTGIVGTTPRALQANAQQQWLRDRQQGTRAAEDVDGRVTSAAVIGGVVAAGAYLAS